MSQSITLTLPDALLGPIQRTAEATGRPVEDVVLTALEASLPPLEGVPASVLPILDQLETLDKVALWQVMLETVPVEQQEALAQLLEQKKGRQLTPEEQAQLEALQRAADVVVFRKARAAVLLRFRGHRVPTASELAELASAAR